MPITAGTRLDQLRDLRPRINLEIELEERRERESRPTPIPQTWAAVGRPAQMRAVDPHPSREEAKRLMAALGCTTKDVKAWAVEQGLLDHVARGTVAGGIVAAYADAHQAAQVTV